MGNKTNHFKVCLYHPIKCLSFSAIPFVYTSEQRKPRDKCQALNTRMLNCSRSIHPLSDLQPLISQRFLQFPLCIADVFGVAPTYNNNILI